MFNKDEIFNNNKSGGKEDEKMAGRMNNLTFSKKLLFGLLK